MIVLDSYVNFLIKYDLTQEQLLTLILLYEERKDLIEKYKQHFKPESGTIISQYLLQDLIKKGLVEKTTNGFKLGKKFLEIYVDPDVATDAVYKAYPAVINMNGVDIPLKTMDRRTFSKIYINKIKGSIDEHLKILDDIKYAKENGLIRTGIEKFIVSEQWKVWRELREPVTPQYEQHDLDVQDDLEDANDYYNDF